MMTYPRYSKPGVLITLCVLFALGGLTRFFPDGIIVMAEAQVEALLDTDTDEGLISETDPAMGDKDLIIPSVEGDRADELRGTDKPACLPMTLAQSLTDDRSRVDAERAENRERTLALQAWETELNTRTVELEALHELLETRWAEMRQIAAEDLIHLAKMYGAMKPDRAAEIFNEMDPKFAAGFLRQLKSDQAGQILSSMDAKKAYRISISLASENADLR